MAIGEILVKVGADVSDYEQNLNKASKTAASFGDKFRGVATTIGSVSLGIAGSFAAMSAGVTLGIGGAIREAATFEDAFTGVRKVVDGTEDDFKMLEQGIRDMSKEIPLASTEIAEIAQTAGQLGIKTPDIMKFTRTMADLGVATNMSATEAATSLARFANITDMSMQDIDRLGATVVDLGNNLATTESEIVTMGQRVAAAGSQVGMTEAEIMSFSGAMSSLGIRAEAGGTAFSRVILNMQSAVMDAGEDLDNFAAVAGMSSQEFAKAFEDDAAGAVMSFIEGLDDMSESGENTVAALDELGLGEVRVRDTLLRMAGNTDLVTESLNIGTKAWEENTALTDEAKLRYETLISQLKILRNRFKDIILIIGKPLMDVFKDILDFIDPFVSKLEELAGAFEEMDDHTKKVIASFAMAVPVILGVMAAIFAIVGGVAFLAVGLASLNFVAVALGIGMTALITGILGVSAVIVGVIAVVGGLVAAFVGLLATSETARDTVVNVFKGIYDTVANVFNEIKETAIGVWDEITSFWQDNVGKFESAFTSIVDSVTETVNEIKEKFSGSFDGVSDTVVEVVHNILEIFGNLIDGLQPFWEALKSSFDTLLDSAAPVLENLQGLFSDLMPVLSFLAKVVGGALVAAFGLVMSQVSGFMRLLGPVINAVISMTRAVVNFVNGVIALFTGDFSGALDYFKDALSNVGDFFVSVWEGVLGYFSGFFETLVGFFNGLWNAITGSTEGFGEVISTFFSDLWESITETASDMWEGFKDMLANTFESIIETITNVWEGVAEWFSELWESITETATGIWEPIQEAWSSVVDYLKELFSPVVEFFSDIWNTVMETIFDVWGIISEGLGEIWNGIKEIAAQVWELIKIAVLTPVLALVDLVTGDMEGLHDHMKQIWERIKDVAKTIWDVLKNTIVSKALEIWENVKIRFNKMKLDIINRVREAKDDAVNKFIEMKDKVVQKVQDIMQNVGEKFAQIKDTIRDKITEAKDALVEKFTTMVSESGNKVQEILQTVKDKFSDIVSAVWDKMVEVKDKIVTGWNDAQSFLSDIDLKQIGIDIIQGLINGIKSMVSNVGKAIGSVASTVKKGITGALGINSPSKVTTQYGKWTGEGMAIGLNKMRNKVGRAADSIAQYATPKVDEIDINYATPAGIRTTMQSAVRGTVEVDTRDDELIQSIRELRRDMTNLRVEMNGRDVGRIIEPYVSQERDRRKKRGARVRGDN